MLKRERVLWAGAVLGAASLIAGVSNAGGLSPSSAPSSTMTSLDEIGQLAAGAAGFTPATVPDAFGGPISMELSINGNSVGGEDEVAGKRDVIQVFGFQEGVVSPTDPATGQPTGHRTYEPIVIRKRIDKSTPLLQQALASNLTVDSLVLKFYRPNPAGDGTTEHFFTVEISEGRVASIRRTTGASTNAHEPPTEEVSIVFHNITWTYEPTGATAADSIGSGPA